MPATMPMANDQRLTPILVFLLLCLLVTTPTLWANSADRQVTLTLSYMENPPATVNELESKFSDIEWLPLKSSSAYMRPHNNHNWIRIDISNHSLESTDRLLELATTDIHSADFYEVDMGTPQPTLKPFYLRLGMDEIFRDRPINYRNIVYPVYIEPGSNRTFLLNVSHAYDMKLNVHLWNKKQFYENATRELVFFGMIYGAFFMIAMYNLFIYISIREKNHLQFVLFSACIALFISTQEGHFSQFIATDLQWDKDIFYALITGLMCFFFAIFSIQFLDLERWSVWLVRTLQASGTIVSLGMVLMGLMPDPLIFSHYTFPMIIGLYGIGIGVGLYVWHRGVTSAGFYTLAIFLCNIGMLMEFASHLAFIPWTKLTYSYASIGNTAMIFVFAFAIADKMRQLQKEKITASMKLVKLTEEKAQSNVDMLKAKLHEAELTREANEAVIENRARNEFLATMSHEIRTPMNGVLGMSELLNDTDLDSKQRHYSASITNSAKALLNAINDLLDYTRIESGKMEFEYRLFNLEKIIDDCISIFALRASEAKISFTGMVQPGTPVQVKGDADKVRQILMNLLVNAFNFTNKNDISIRAYPTGKSTINSIEIRFDITAHDIELSSEELNSLFSPLQDRHEGERKHSGHELGLTVSRQLAELMQGSIGIETTSGNTTLWFTARFILPHASEEKKLPDRSRVLNGRRLLIADNHAAFSDSVKLLAESWGMQVSVANHSRLLIETLFGESTPFQVLLITAEMLTPEIQLALRQSNVNHNFNTAVILATTSYFSADLDELKKQGINTILEIPYTTAELYESLLKVMGLDTDHHEPTAANLDMNVLVAEDNNVNLTVIEGFLKKLKIYPSSASDGKMALASYENSKRPFTLIFMDCEMPEMDGYEATKAIRLIEKNQQLTPTIIIGLSAHSSSEYKDKALLAGMNDFLIKPLNIEDLENVLERVRSNYYIRHNA